MSPGQVQPVVIYGTPCALQLAPANGGGYAVTDTKTGAVLAQQFSRFAAVAQAAAVLRSKNENSDS